jgi:endonuclease YncB( thermonuclease family)
MSLIHDNFVIVKKGEAPDPKNGVFYDQAVPKILRDWETEKDLVLYNCEDKSTLGYEDRVALCATYAAHLAAIGHLKHMEVRDSAGNGRPVGDLQAELDQLRTTKSGGLYYEPQKVWLLSPPDMNTEYENDLEAFAAVVTSSLRLIPHPMQPGGPANASSGSNAYRDAYPTEVVEESDMDFFPGLSGNKILEGTVNFVQNAHPATRIAVGMLIGVVAYKSMGLKGLVGLVLLAMALKRVMTMGSKVMENHRLDLVTRTMQEGLPVNQNGKIDPEVLDALRNYPAGDHEIASREIDPAIMRRRWERNPIHIDPDIPIREHEDTVQQVVDGDTFYGTSGAHYRLVGIDTPELHLDSGTQPGAQRAWDRVRELIPDGTKVRVEVVGNQPAEHGRLPVYVYAKDAEGKEHCLNKLLLAEGLARITNFDPYHPKMEEFISANLEAIETKRGLWNKRFNPAMAPRPGFLSINKQETPNPSGGRTISFSMS